MTSTTFSKFRQGKSFFLWSLYTGKTTMIIYLSLLTFFCSVIAVFALGITLQTDLDASVWEAASYFTLFFTMLLGFVFTFVFSIKEFSYLHDKRKTDMFGALPASRRTIFFSKLAAVIVQSALPVILIITFLSIMNGGTLTNFFEMGWIFGMPEAEATDKNLWYMLLEAVVGLITNAVFLGFLSVCCGKTVDKILTYLIINAAYPIAALLVQVLPGSFLFGYTIEINEFFTCALSPYTSVWSINPAYWGGLTVLLGVLCFFILPKRKAECAQSHFAFKAPLIITKVLVSFAVGMVVAYFFGIVFSAIKLDKIAFIIGWIMGSFIAYFVFQIIFAKGFKRFGWGMIPYAALGVCFAVMITVLLTGLFGYENYVPDADEVESVSLIGDKQVIVDGKNVIDGTITGKKQIEECIEGHKEALAYCKTHTKTIAELTFGNNSFDNYDILMDDLNGGAVKFKYKLKNGMTVSRDYGEYWDSEIKFTKSKTYSYYTNSLFLIDPEYITDLYFDYDYDEDTNDYESEEYDDYDAVFEIDGETYALDDSSFKTKDKRIELVQALRSDILEYGEDSGTGVCYVNLEYGGTDDYAFENDFADYPIRSTYKKTVELLKENATKIGKTTKNKVSA
ncbi:MAG: hypothetical protein K6F88_01115 [Ruminococcus sp.]|nr:hypothetical protein [Ruminococcus sp.]